MADNINVSNCPPTNVTSNDDHYHQLPLQIFILIYYVCVLCELIYRKWVSYPPSVFILSTQLFITIISFIIIHCFTFVNVTLGWIITTCFVLVLLLTTFLIMFPDLVLYKQFS
jgi:hypothetical protein